MPTFAAPTARIYYEQAGAGVPLLNIGGTGGDLRRPPSSFEWPGARRFEQVAYDHRGLGRSRAADPAAQPTMADFADDALALVDHLGWQRFSLIGISFGGMVAQEVAIRAGDRVRRLVLACTSSGAAGGASAPLHEILALAPALRAERLIELLDTRTRDDAALRAELSAVFAPLTAEPPGARLQLAMARQLEARRRHDTWARLDAIRAPTLVAAGRYDGLAPVENSRALAGAIAGARLEIFDGGHAFLLQDPAAWRVAGDFLLAED
jgi:3-oxoadipate enol-lactonase